MYVYPPGCVVGGCWRWGDEGGSLTGVWDTVANYGCLQSLQAAVQRVHAYVETLEEKLEKVEKGRK